MRAVTVVGVIAVHATFFTNPDTSVNAGSVILLLHYTREVFLFLTGFVLIHSDQDRPLRPLAFWKRRIPIIVAPYLLWTLVYASVALHPEWRHLGGFAETLALDSARGTAWYHLYYLLITLQVYMLFPLLRSLVHRSRRTSQLVWFTGSVIAQVLIMVAYRHPLVWSPHWAFMFRYRDMECFSYQSYLLGGALFAANFEIVDRWVRAHSRTIVVCWLLSGLYLLHSYWQSPLNSEQAVMYASAVFQPLMVPYCLLTITVLYLASGHWMRSRRTTRLRPVVERIAGHSFGLYLLHPLILYFLLNWLSRPMTGWWPLGRTTLVIGLTLVVTDAAISAITMTPLSRYLVGRPALPWRFGVRPSRTKPSTR